MKTSTILEFAGVGFTAASSALFLITKEREKIKNRDKISEAKPEHRFYKSKKYIW